MSQFWEDLKWTGGKASDYAGILGQRVGVPALEYMFGYQPGIYSNPRGRTYGPLSQLIGALPDDVAALDRNGLPLSRPPEMQYDGPTPPSSSSASYDPQKNATTGPQRPASPKAPPYNPEDYGYPKGFVGPTNTGLPEGSILRGGQVYKTGSDYSPQIGDASPVPYEPVNLDLSLKSQVDESLTVPEWQGPLQEGAQTTGPDYAKMMRAFQGITYPQIRRMILKYGAREASDPSRQDLNAAIMAHNQQREARGVAPITGSVVENLVTTYNPRGQTRRVPDMAGVLRVKNPQLQRTLLNLLQNQPALMQAYAPDVVSVDPNAAAGTLLSRLQEAMIANSQSRYS